VGLLVLALAGAAAAASTIRGVVKDVDGRTRVVVLEDGRQVTLDDRSVILVDNRPVQLATLKPGTTVMVVSETRTARSSTVPPARPRTGETVLITGTVAQVDSGTKTLVLQDGRQVKLDDRSQVFMDDRSVPLSTLKPGTRVVVTSEPLMVQESALPRAAVETVPVTGTVARIDSGAQTIVLSDGRVIETRPDTVVLVQDRPVELAAVKVGDLVVVRPVATAGNAVVIVRSEEAVPPGGSAVVRRAEAVANPGRVEPWPSNVPESEMMLEPQAP
jgi:hypothetical protein